MLRDSSLRLLSCTIRVRSPHAVNIRHYYFITETMRSFDRGPSESEHVELLEPSFVSNNKKMQRQSEPVAFD